MSTPGGLHVRAGSIRRTPSDLSKSLAECELPDPSAITEAGNSQVKELKTEEVNDRLGELEFEQEPEALVMAHRRRASEQIQDAMSVAFSSLDLGAPERVTRANARADGATTPIPPPRTEASAVEVIENVSGENVDVEAAGDQVVTPWDVQGAVVGGVQMAIDYNKLIDQFGTVPIDKALLERFERLTGRKPHLLLRRGTFFSHREFNLILDRYEKKLPFYLYTGRGPSSDSMHIGHMIPFVFTQWLQEVFDVPLVVQLTDDEKFLFKPDLKLEQCNGFAYQNARDVIACGFKLEKTFIFSDLDYVGGAFYKNVVRISRLITARQSQQTFGFDLSDNIGKWHFVAVQAAPSFSNSFPQIYGTKTDIPCLIPCAIDQDPYFRLTREAAVRLKYKKPALIHAKFIPSLLGAQSKMSASDTTTSIYMTDKPNEIKNKINKYAFSGGQDTLEKHRALGGDPEVDVAFQYLTFFLEDDEELDQVAKDYRAGTLTSGELKKKTITLLQEFVKAFQDRKAAITDDILKSFMDPSRAIDPTVGSGATTAAATL